MSRSTILLVLIILFLMSRKSAPAAKGGTYPGGPVTAFVADASSDAFVSGTHRSTAELDMTQY